MKLYIIDTNLIFSAIHRPSSEIGQFFGSPLSAGHELLTPETVLLELYEHQNKLMALTGLNPKSLHEHQSLMMRNIVVVPEATIPAQHFMRAAPIVRDIDPEDIAFVALNDYRDG